MSVRRTVADAKSESKAVVILGIFIFVSGVWVLTDSRALAVFTIDYGGILDKNIISFASFVCFMLLPIIFISFLQYIFQVKKILWVIDGLFILNLFLFVILSFLDMPKGAYLASLLTHHAFMYIFMAIGAVYCIKNLRGSEDMQVKLLSRGVLFIMFFSAAAMIAFISGLYDLYAILFGTGFIIMIQYMIKLTVNSMLASYNKSLKAELYKSIAYTDILTDIKNRNTFIKEQYNSAVDENTCCIIMDVNHLKKVNDELGHSYGDQLIRRSARVIHNTFSGVGICYRIGGDEFAVVCRDFNEAAVKAAIEKMETSISAANLEHDPKISLSYGYAFARDGISNFMELFNAADRDMYRDKRRRKADRK